MHPLQKMEALEKDSQMNVTVTSLLHQLSTKMLSKS